MTYERVILSIGARGKAGIEIIGAVGKHRTRKALFLGKRYCWGSFGIGNRALLS